MSGLGMGSPGGFVRSFVRSGAASSKGARWASLVFVEDVEDGGADEVVGGHLDVGVDLLLEELGDLLLVGAVRDVEAVGVEERVEVLELGVDALLGGLGEPPGL